MFASAALTLALLAAAVSAASADGAYGSCPKLYPNNFVGAAPRGNLTAGNYTERPDLVGMKRCVAGCCASGACNVAFGHGTACYHLECVSNAACLPLQRRDGLDHIATVLVRPVDDESWREALERQNYDIDPELVSEDEIVDRDDFEDRSESILAESMKYGPEVLSRLAENADGRRFLGDAFKELDDRPAMEASEYAKTVACEVGILTDCPPNEECASAVSKSRSGICRCVRGHVRDRTGVCKRRQYFSDAIDKESVPKETQNAPSEKAETLRKPEETSSSPSETNAKKLTVSAISKEIRLPENEVTLNSYTIPDEKTSGDHYNYVWTLVQQPKDGFKGIMKGQNGAAVTLSQLTEGNYTFKVMVTGSLTNSIGEAFANVTVLPANRMNKAPVVVITPASQTVKLPNTGAVLDGSDSKDDDAIISWRWELTFGPLGYQPPVYDGPTLQLKDLKLPGNYTFRLTVEDSDHVKNSTTANITVLNHTDYPPEANAGQDIIIYLPTNNLTLNGNLSSDDHEIVTWEWTKSSEDQNKAVDMQNTHSPYLQLSNLSEGVYTFVLKVTDSSGQSSQADVHVFVKPPTNNPPVAKAGKKQYISLPVTWVTLNGSESVDDHRIVAYTWQVLKGPNNGTLTNYNESVTNMTGLTKGTYLIRLTVLDDNGNSASDTVEVIVTQNKNAAPKANAGGDQTLILPISVIVLNGSQSQDDLRIARWLWSRQPTGLASGKIIAETDQQPVLMLTEAVPGRYVFSLTVWDDQGLSDTDTVSINVKPDPNIKNLVRLTLNVPTSVLTYAAALSLEQKLGFLMGQSYNINISDIRSDQLTTKAQIVFFVSDKNTPGVYLTGPQVVSRLKSKLRRDAGLLDVSVTKIDTIVCQNNCSGHGVCDEPTRSCHCEAFWMQNILTSFMEDKEANCDWSVLYVAIGGLLIALCIILPIWGLCYLMQKICSRKSGNVHRRVARYTLLGGGDEEETTRFTQSKMSVSDTDTDSDILFESRNKSTTRFSGSNGDAIRLNGHGAKASSRNGFAKSSRRIKT